MADMGGILAVDNPIAWAIFRQRGGWRGIATSAILYAAVIGGMMLLTVRLEPGASSNILHGWTIGLMLLQGGVLLLVGSGAVRNSIRKDIDTNLIESHRLMPIPAGSAIAGYIIGSTGQVLGVAGVNLLLGMIAATGAGMPVGDWIISNTVLLVFTLQVWIVVTLLAQVTKMAIGLLLILTAVAVGGGSIILGLVPGLAILIGPAIGGAIFRFASSGRFFWGPEHLLSMGLQGLASIFFFLAATRKYRDPHRPAFSPASGLGFQAVFVTLSIAGIIAWQQLQGTFIGMPANSIEAQIIFSTIVAILLGLIPIASTAWVESQHRRRKRLNDPDPPGRPDRLVVVAVVAAGIVFLLPMATAAWSMDASHGRTPPQMGLLAGLTALAALLSVGFLLRIPYRVGKRIVWPLALWLLATWFGPLVLDALRFFMLTDQRGDSFTALSAVSPIGVLLTLSEEWEFNPMPGLIVQFLITAGLAALVRSTEPKPATEA